MGELLLLSNSTAPGLGFLEHAIEAIQDVLGGRAASALNDTVTELFGGTPSGTPTP